jgi:hypothetical protein
LGFFDQRLTEVMQEVGECIKHLEVDGFGFIVEFGELEEESLRLREGGYCVELFGVFLGLGLFFLTHLIWNYYNLSTICIYDRNWFESPIPFIY